MPLIASVSGIRGVFGDGLDPATLTKYAGGFGAWLRGQSERETPLVVVGRDGRVTGDVCARLVTATLQASGCDVIDAGLATTPSVAMGVLKHDADGAIILSASHNPAEWNALKLLDARGEFLGTRRGREVPSSRSRRRTRRWATKRSAATRRTTCCRTTSRRSSICRTSTRRRSAARGFKVVVDGINSVGAFAIPAVLEASGRRRRGGPERRRERTLRAQPGAAARAHHRHHEPRR